MKAIYNKGGLTAEFTEVETSAILNSIIDYYHNTLDGDKDKSPQAKALKNILKQLEEMKIL